MLVETNGAHFTHPLQQCSVLSNIYNMSSQSVSSVYNMSGRVVSDLYNTAAHVVNYLQNEIYNL
jgi:hypothetical protein